MSIFPCSLHSNQMLNHKYKKNCRADRTQNFFLVWLPTIYLLWRFPTSSPRLFSDSLHGKNWINILTQEGVIISRRTLEQGLCPNCLQITLGRLANFKAITLIVLFVAAPRTSSCPLCRRLLFRNHLQSHLQGICSLDATASSVSAHSYAVLCLETRPN